MTIHDIAKTERTEMYVKALYMVSQSAPPATISKIADYMRVSAPSASEMLKRLEAQGLVFADAAHGHTLSASGLETATRVVRRLRLAERLLTDVLHLDLPLVYAEACKLEHVISPEVETRLNDVLGRPAACPHGYPIPGNAPAVAEPWRTLDQTAVWDRVSIVSIPEEDEALVGHLAEVGLLPGTTVLLREFGPMNGPITIQVSQQIRAIGRDVARRLRVRTVTEPVSTNG
jgi:Mn-dependent DtxR family transcriptional regulator/Fe2+ transport system protein FeoA